MYKGTANDMDDQVRARGATASIVGEPFGTNEDKDMFLENQELKVVSLHHFLLDTMHKAEVIYSYNIL